MAGPWYVQSGAAGTATGLSWANAKTTLAAAATAASAGDTIYVSDTHAETQGSAMTVTFTGTAAAPTFVCCADHTQAVPGTGDLKTSATVTTTGNFAMTLAGSAFVYGIAFSAGSGAVNAQMIVQGAWMYLSACKLIKAGTSGSQMAIGVDANSTACRIILDNTTIQVGSTGDVVAMRCVDFRWKNTASAIAGATIPTTLFSNSNSRGFTATIEGVDLSAVTGTLVSTVTDPAKFFFKDCKIAATVTIAATPTNQGSCETYLIRCDSGTKNYRTEKYQYMGTQTVETTIIRTGGATDGTTPISWKIVTTANSKWMAPFEAVAISIWTDTTGSAVTLTVFGIWGGGAVPNTDDIWMDVEYLGSSATPVGSFTTTTKANNLATGSALATDTSSWGGSTTKFKISVSVTPQIKGPLTVYVKAAKASSTFYIDPLIVLS